MRASILILLVVSSAFAAPVTEKQVNDNKDVAKRSADGETVAHRTFRLEARLQAELDRPKRQDPTDENYNNEGPGPFQVAEEQPPQPSADQQQQQSQQYFPTRESPEDEARRREAWYRRCKGRQQAQRRQEDPPRPGCQPYRDPVPQQPRPACGQAQQQPQPQYAPCLPAPPEWPQYPRYPDLPEDSRNPQKPAKPTKYPQPAPPPQPQRQYGCGGQQAYQQSPCLPASQPQPQPQPQPQQQPQQARYGCGGQPQPPVQPQPQPQPQRSYGCAPSPSAPRRIEENNFPPASSGCQYQQQPQQPSPCQVYHYTQPGERNENRPNEFRQTTGCISLPNNSPQQQTNDPCEGKVQVLSVDASGKVEHYMYNTAKDMGEVSGDALNSAVDGVKQGASAVAETADEQPASTSEDSTLRA